MFLQSKSTQTILMKFTAKHLGAIRKGFPINKMNFLVVILHNFKKCIGVGGSTAADHHSRGSADLFSGWTNELKTVKGEAARAAKAREQNNRYHCVKRTYKKIVEPEPKVCGCFIFSHLFYHNYVTESKAFLLFIFKMLSAYSWDTQ